MRNNPDQAEMCLKHGVGGVRSAMIACAVQDHAPVMKVFLEHWTGEDEMVWGN